MRGRHKLNPAKETSALSACCAGLINNKRELRCGSGLFHRGRICNHKFSESPGRVEHQQSICPDCHAVNTWREPVSIVPDWTPAQALQRAQEETDQDIVQGMREAVATVKQLAVNFSEMLNQRHARLVAA